MVKPCPKEMKCDVEVVVIHFMSLEFLHSICIEMLISFELSLSIVNSS